MTVDNNKGMNIDEIIEAAFAPGWLIEVAQQIEKDIKHWPEWRRKYDSREIPTENNHDPA